MDETDWLDVAIARKWTEAVGVAGFELVPAGGGVLPAFDAGAFVDVLTPGGHLRPYSLCNSPTERHRYVIAVLREPSGRGGSIAFHERAKQGDRLRIRAPRNEFALHTAAVYSVLLGGGIGVTPLLGMADTLWRQGAGFELHYSARNAERAAFDEALRKCSYGARVRRHWSEESGRIGFEQVFARVPALSHLYLCGPGSFIDSAVAAATKLGWPLERLHLESFRPVQRLAFY
jgi:vanillate monooxygenase ferredoxin subunit